MGPRTSCRRGAASRKIRSVPALSSCARLFPIRYEAQTTSCRRSCSSAQSAHSPTLTIDEVRDLAGPAAGEIRLLNSIAAITDRRDESRASPDARISGRARILRRPHAPVSAGTRAFFSERSSVNAAPQRHRSRSTPRTMPTDAPPPPDRSHAAAHPIPRFPA